MERESRRPTRLDPKIARACGVVALAAVSANCGAYAAAAQRAFVHETSCPAERVTVLQRDPATVPQLTPPPDVAADPQRLDLWNRNQARERRGWTYFDVEGCGTRRTMRCASADDGSICVDSIADALARVEALQRQTSIEQTATPEDLARLATLPHVAARYDLPTIPDALRGLRVRPHASIAGPLPADSPPDHAMQLCITGFETDCGLLGWMVVTDPTAPVDLDVTFSCNGQVTPTLRGNSLEVRMPLEVASALTIFKHGDSVVETFPHGPLDLVCESSGSPLEIARDCVDRIRSMAQARFIGQVVGSQALQQFAAGAHANASH